MPVEPSPPVADASVAVDSPTRDRLAVFDLDGVLADVRHRLHHIAGRPKHWDRFFSAAVDDPPLPEGLAAVAEAVRTGHTVVYLTGRPDRCRSDTLEWLARHDLPAAALHMRGDTDRRPARFTKLAVLRTLARQAHVAAVVDDDPAVVEVLRSAGFPVLHATWMSTSPSTSGSESPPLDAQAVLFEVQEAEGRT